MKKRVKIAYLYWINLIVFITSILSIILMDSSVEIWFSFLVLLVLSVFETIFYYKYNDNSFSSMDSLKALECILISIGATVVVIGSILFLKIIL